MCKLPKHLEKILRVTEHSDTYMSGKIVCECGCKVFEVRYFGEQYPPHCVGVMERGGKYATVIKAKCRDCGKEYELYDFSKHAHDGFVCEDGFTVSDEELITAVAGDERDFEIEMSIEFFGEEQFTEEFIDFPPDGMSFTPDDRVNIWSWVVINLKGAGSGKKFKFVDDELA